MCSDTRRRRENPHQTSLLAGIVGGSDGASIASSEIRVAMGGSAATDVESMYVPLYRGVVMVAIAQNYQWTFENPELFDEFTVHHASAALQAEFEGSRIVTHVRNQLRLRSSFFGPFLCAIALPAPEAAAAAAPGGARCLLPRLDIGEEKPIQQLIAAFTGVPVGSSWRAVQLAAAHLENHLT